jgi:YesN/AraC family two-component response regulator
MPGMNGLELSKIIKLQFSHLKVFTITAYEDEENHQTTDAYGADDYIQKPMDFKQFKEKMLDLVSQAD